MVLEEPSGGQNPVEQQKLRERTCREGTDKVGRQELASGAWLPGRRFLGVGWLAVLPARPLRRVRCVCVCVACCVFALARTPGARAPCVRAGRGGLRLALPSALRGRVCVVFVFGCRALLSSCCLHLVLLRRRADCE